MAHQAHNIPWSNVSKSLTPRPGDQERRPRTPLNEDSPESRQLDHFSRVFAQTLDTFATTKRESLHKAAPRQKNNALLSNDELILVGEYIERHQRGLSLEKCTQKDYWLEPASYADPRAELIMALVATRQVDPVFKLAHLRDKENINPLIALHTMPGPNPGWSQVWQSALASYIYLNVIYCQEGLWAKRETRARYLDDPVYHAMIGICTQMQDGDTFTIPHRVFYGQSAEVTDDYPQYDTADPLKPDQESLIRLREYLKQCWETLTICGAIWQELGGGVDWSEEVRGMLQYLWGVSR